MENVVQDQLQTGLPRCTSITSFQVKEAPIHTITTGLSDDTILISGWGGTAEYGIDGDHVADITMPYTDKGLSAVRPPDDDGIFITDPLNKKAFYRAKHSSRWQQLEKGKLNSPCSLTLTTDGDVCLLDAGTSSMHTFNSRGKLMSTIQLDSQAGMTSGENKYLAITPEGELAVSDGEQHCIHLFTPSGRLRGTVGKPWQAGRENGQLDEPRGIHWDSKGQLLVADWHNHRVQVYSHQGQYTTTLLYRERDELVCPRALYLTQHGKLLVGESGSNTVKVYNYIP